MSRAASAGPTGDLPRWRPGPARIDARVVALSGEGALVPASCACCGDVAAESRVERSPRGQKSVIVPYCGPCHRHASAVRTRVLSATLASCLLAATLAAGLPLLLERLSGWLFVTMVLVGALVPPALAWLWPRSVQPGHSAAGRAAWWLHDGGLACTRARWAAELAVGNGTDPERRVLREPVVSPWMYSGAVFALAVAPFFQWLYHPLVRVLDLTPDRIELRVDGQRVAVVEPTSAESPQAGVELHLPSGRRHLEVRDAIDGHVVASADVTVEAGAKHLYAPASDDYCFWLETNGYGRAGAPGPAIRPLVGSSRFWALPLEVDSWFAPNPAPAAQDRRSSGGVLTALRQAPCAEAPAEARDAR